MFFFYKIRLFINTMSMNILRKKYPPKGKGVMQMLTRLTKGGEGEEEKCWQWLTKGGGRVGELLKMADKVGRGGLDPTIFGWHNLLTAPYVGIKTGSKKGSKVRGEIVSKVGSKIRSKNSVLTFLMCMDGSILAFLKFMDGLVLDSLKCMDGSVLAHLRFFHPICPH